METKAIKRFIDEERLSQRVSQLGAELERDYAGRQPVFVGVLRGCFVFMADLVRACRLPCTVDFMVVSSYGSGTRTTGAVKIEKDLSDDIAGRDVILVEDILDSGVTLSYLTEYMRAKGPASVRIVTLLDKPSRRSAPVEADYVGFTVPDEFVIGYGLDYDQRYRNLPYIGILDPEML